jgi:hypothetical protein
VPLLDERAVNEAVQFDSRFGNASMRTLLDTLIIGALGIDLGRLHKDHIRDLIVGEIFTMRRAWGMSPIQIVLYLDGSTTSGHA